MSARNPQDIAQYSNNKNMLIASDYLKITKNYYGSIHAEKEGNEIEWKQYSRIRFTLIEHKNKSKQHCMFNLSVDDCRWIFHMISCNVINWTFSREKIVGENVSKILIKRQSTDSYGKPRKLPWYIEISNGTGVPEQKGNLNTCKKGTYKEKTKLYINISDENFYTFMKRIERFIEIFETAYSGYIMQQKVKYEEKNKNWQGGSM